MALKNGIAIPKSLIQVNRPFHIGSRYGCLDLFCGRQIFKITSILICLWSVSCHSEKLHLVLVVIIVAKQSHLFTGNFIWDSCVQEQDKITSPLSFILHRFIDTLVYYGLSLNAKHLGGDIYMNFFLYSLMEIPAYLTCLCFINWIGRRKSVCYYMIAAGCACLGCLFIQSSSNTNVTTTLTTVFAMIAKFGISASFAVIYIYSAELLPTVVRNVGMGVCSMSSRIAGICAPFIVYLGTYSKPLPIVIFGMCSFSAGLLCLALPETLNKPLPETLDDTTGFDNLRSGISYQQLEMSHLAFVQDEEVFQANDSDFDYDDELVTEKTTFI
ncbi:hypothetical protein QZH41_012218 [Actinostola sp. cb2023]|nr:hypothetical protein QZH41_012218 [Actinostola sp. cb2023]